MRGEEVPTNGVEALNEELPPHARRRGIPALKIFVMLGITSACAEKSHLPSQISKRLRNYLRMRGEEAHHYMKP